MSKLDKILALYESKGSDDFNHAQKHRIKALFKELIEDVLPFDPVAGGLKAEILNKLESL